MCLQSPHLSLKQIAASALCDISKHNLELAQNIVDAGAIPYLAKNLSNLDEKLKRQVLAALSACAKHSPELAEVVIEAEVFPSVFMHMAHNCPQVRYSFIFDTPNLNVKTSRLGKMPLLWCAIL